MSKHFNTPPPRHATNAGSRSWVEGEGKGEGEEKEERVMEEGRGKGGEGEGDNGGTEERGTK